MKTEKREKLKFKILLASLALNLAFATFNFKKYLDTNRNGMYDVCLAQGNTKVQCNAIARLIERQKQIEIRN